MIADKTFQGQASAMPRGTLLLALLDYQVPFY